MKKDIYCTPLRLNLRNQRHRKVYEILQNLPEGCSISAYVIQAVLDYDDTTAGQTKTRSAERPAPAVDWKKEIRKIVREELAGPVESTQEDARRDMPDSREGIVPASDDEQARNGSNDISLEELSEDTLDDLEALLGLAE